MIPRIRSQSANASYSGRVSGESETVERAVVELLLAGSAASASGAARNGPRPDISGQYHPP